MADGGARYLAPLFACLRKLAIPAIRARSHGGRRCLGDRDEHKRRREGVEEMARFAATPVKTCGLCVLAIGFCAYIGNRFTTSTVSYMRANSCCVSECIKTKASRQQLAVKRIRQGRSIYWPCSLLRVLRGELLAWHIFYTGSL